MYITHARTTHNVYITCAFVFVTHDVAMQLQWMYIDKRCDVWYIVIVTSHINIRTYDNAHTFTRTYAHDNMCDIQCQQRNDTFQLMTNANRLSSHSIRWMINKRSCVNMRRVCNVLCIDQRMTRTHNITNVYAIKCWRTSRYTRCATMLIAQRLNECAMMCAHTRTRTM